MLICFSPSDLDAAAARDWQQGKVKKPSRILKRPSHILVHACWWEHSSYMAWRNELD